MSLGFFFFVTLTTSKSEGGMKMKGGTLVYILLSIQLKGRGGFPRGENYVCALKQLILAYEAKIKIKPKIRLSA